MGSRQSLEVQVLSSAVLVEEHEVPMWDGVKLRVNVCRPNAEGTYPVLVHCVPYGKDQTCKRYLGGRVQVHSFQYQLMEFILQGDIGRVNLSEQTPWEAADPNFWVSKGYIVVQADSRGFYRSEGVGEAAVLGGGHERIDFYELVEWAGQMPWSTGKVGMIGVSYLAISQWFGAATRPPHLAAICPWEGFADFYRHFAFVGGVGPTKFGDIWVGGMPSLAKSHLHKEFPLTEQWENSRKNNNLNNDFYKSLIAPVENIEVPVLCCASWSDQGIHNPGTQEAFERLKCQKWLYTHGRSKWEVFYSESEFQCQFFDHFLKGEANGWERTPPVRLEIRDTYNTYTVRSEPEWPLQRTEYTRLYLKANNLMCPEPEATASVTTYRARESSAQFLFTFTEETELTGYFMLRLWVSCEGHNDADILVYAYKRNAHGQLVNFHGAMGDKLEGVSKGKFRASHRVSYSPEKSRVGRPYYEHTTSAPLPSNGSPVAVDVPMFPSSTVFHRGEQLELHVTGRDIASFFVLKHPRLCNPPHANHRVFMGGQFDSYLLVPKIPTSSL